MKLPKTFAVDDDLGTGISGGLEQDGVHVDVGGDARSLRLDDLGPAHFTAFRGDEAVQGHVLGLEGSDADAFPFENPAKGRC